MSGQVLIGTASWTDKSLIESGRFYPPGATNAEARLQFYAANFPLVEVDSSYYGMPSERNSALWVERTPDHFTFDIKAFSLFTQHPTRPAALPKDVREQLSPETLDKPNLYDKDLTAELRDALWERFAEALLPLDSAGKLGVVLFQFPPWFMPGRESFSYLDELTDRLPQYRPAVEFRNPRWLDDEHVERTLAFLSERGLPYVCVDEPQGTRASVPPVLAATARMSVIRFHGRNREQWTRRGATVSEKYNYLYSTDELEEWVPGIKRLAGQSEAVHILMNNCHEDKAVVNAKQLAMLLRDA
ncbi:MAG: DUF72 domain-containing protein [Dehalococcoidia bacterium]